MVKRAVNGMTYTLDELKAIITPIAVKHGVDSVSVFGSYAKGDANVNSDVDLKIEKGLIRSLFQLSGFRREVEEALRLSVDIVTGTSSDQNFLRSIQKDEVLLYQRA